MPTVFLCHASENKSVAESIQLALVNAGCDVFYDEYSLPPGGDFHERIRAAIAQCDLFVFLISHASISPGKFTLTELKFARERWPSPVNRVLPVNLEGLPERALPNYLTAATVLSVRGNPAAEVRAAAETMLRDQKGKRPKWLPLTSALGGAALAISITVVRLREPTSTPPQSRVTDVIVERVDDESVILDFRVLNEGSVDLQISRVLLVPIRHWSVECLHGAVDYSKVYGFFDLNRMELPPGKSSNEVTVSQTISAGKSDRFGLRVGDTSACTSKRWLLQTQLVTSAGTLDGKEVEIDIR